MSGRLACLALALALVPAAAWSAQDRGAAPAPAVCPGPAQAELERRMPEGAQRFAQGPEMLPAFVQIWQASRRAVLPGRPDGVTVYAATGLPFLVAFRAGGCVVAILRIERGELLRLLDQRLGFAV